MIQRFPNCASSEPLLSCSSHGHSSEEQHCHLPLSALSPSKPRAWDTLLSLIHPQFTAQHEFKSHSYRGVEEERRGGATAQKEAGKFN